MGAQGLFVGLTTLDLIYRLPQMPGQNQKINATAMVAAAGGPATNAAVTFQGLGNHARIISALGQHPLTYLIHQDLQAQGVVLTDLLPEILVPPPISSIMVTTTTGERAVVSCNALDRQAPVESLPLDSPGIVEKPQIVLIDGHQMAVGGSLAHWARQQNIPVVIDAGSWKAGFEKVLTLADYVIGSANFYPPGCATEAAVLTYLRDLGVRNAAITHGEQPIVYCSHQESGSIALLPVPVVDTLGAGDVFHGAFCHFILTMDFVSALTHASRVATVACQFFGTRSWLTALEKADLR